MSEVVVPVVAAVEDSDILRDIEVEQLVGWEGPDAVVETVREGGK